MQSNRECGLDFLKICACCFIVALHTVNPTIGDVNFIIIALGSISIPMFLVVNGYLMFQKVAIKKAYIWKKILRILVVCFLFESAHAFAFFVYYRQFRNFLTSFILDFFQEGLFYHFWFLGALIIMYMFLPLLRRLYEKNVKAFMVLYVAIGAICVSVGLVMLITKKALVLQVPQNLRIWYWLFYYMTGGIIAKEKEKIWSMCKRMSSITGTFVVGTIVLMLIVWQGIFRERAIETTYGDIPVMLATAAVFIYVANKKMRYRAWITYLSSLTIGIYIFHPFILAILNKFIPIFSTNDAGVNLLFWMATLIISGMLTAIVRTIPVVKELVKL